MAKSSFLSELIIRAIRSRIFSLAAASNIDNAPRSCHQWRRHRPMPFTFHWPRSISAYGRYYCRIWLSRRLILLVTDGFMTAATPAPLAQGRAMPQSPCHGGGVDFGALPGGSSAWVSAGMPPMREDLLPTCICFMASRKSSRCRRYSYSTGVHRSYFIYFGCFTKSRMADYHRDASIDADDDVRLVSAAMQHISGHRYFCSISPIAFMSVCLLSSSISRHVVELLP